MNSDILHAAIQEATPASLADPGPPPRIAPIEPAAWTDEVRAVFAVMDGEEGRKNGSPLNIVRTLAHNPTVSIPFLELNRVLLFDCTLPMRLREIAVLRIAVLSNSRYEWVQHVKIGRRFGLTDMDFAAIEANAPRGDWSVLDRLMLETANELETSNTLSDDLWARLSAHYDTAAILELLYILGAYKMSAWIFNAVGVQPES